VAGAGQGVAGGGAPRCATVGTMSDPPPGAEEPAPIPADLRARYRFRRELGAGGFGRVVEAEDLEVGRPVALKLATLADPEQRRRFLREARTLAGVRHPHVVEVYDYGEAADGTPYLVLELLAGGNAEGLRLAPAILAVRPHLGPDHSRLAPRRQGPSRPRAACAASEPVSLDRTRRP